MFAPAPKSSLLPEEPAVGKIGIFANLHLCNFAILHFAHARTTHLLPAEPAVGKFGIFANLQF